MSTIDGMYIGAAGVVIPKLAHAPIPAPYWKLPFAISFAVILLIPHYLAFATPSRDQMIREHFSTYPIPEKLGTILVLAWSIGGPRASPWLAYSNSRQSETGNVASSRGERAVYARVDGPGSFLEEGYLH